MRSALCAAALNAIVFVASTSNADTLARARQLDAQGVAAFGEARYNDAILYFEEALRAGGPPTEIWNIAKCRLRLDQPEDANAAFEQYLAQTGLSPDDRAEATAELEELRHRSSVLTVSSSPAGAAVFVDDVRTEEPRTPLSTRVTPGHHVVTVRRAGSKPEVVAIDAHFGRAVIVNAHLTSVDEGAASESAREHASGFVGVPRPFRAFAEIGVIDARYGSVGGVAHAAGFFGADYAFARIGIVDLTLGARLTITTDSWGNTIAAPANPQGCGDSIPNQESARALDAFVALGAHFLATSRLHLGGDLGFGIATLATNAVGGDVFVPSCSPQTGAVPAFHAGLDLSYSLAPALRILANPIVFEASGAFDGTRVNPLDASGSWLRFGAGLGVAIDL